MASRALVLTLIFGLLAVSLATRAATLPHFTQPNAVWNEDVSSAPLRANSAAMMTHIESLSTGTGKWGDTRSIDFQIDFSMYVLHATGSTPTYSIVAFPDVGSYYSPDCE